MKKDNKVLKIINKVLKWISSVILTMLVILGILLIFVFVTGKIAQNKGERPPISLYTIISPSMTPNINVYDIVIVAKTDVNKLKEGDVISFYSGNSYFDNTPITHRINQKISTNDNQIAFRTKGDANPVVDDNIVYEKDIVGKVLFKVPALGRVQFFLASKGGWFIAILIPAMAVIAYDIFKLAKLIIVKNKIRTIRKEGVEIGEKADEELEINKPYENYTQTMNDEELEDIEYNPHYEEDNSYTHESSQTVDNIIETNAEVSNYTTEEYTTGNYTTESYREDYITEDYTTNSNDYTSYQEELDSTEDYKEDTQTEDLSDLYEKYNIERDFDEKI